MENNNHWPLGLLIILLSIQLYQCFTCSSESDCYILCRMRRAVTTWLIGYQTHLLCYFYCKRVSKLLEQEALFHGENLPLRHHCLGGWLKYVLSYFVLIILACEFYRAASVLLLLALTLWWQDQTYAIVANCLFRDSVLPHPLQILMWMDLMLFGK